MASVFQRWVLPVLYFSDNWISRIGLLLVTSATVLWIFLTGANTGTGYVGILQFVALPAAFFLGLALIPLGIARQKRRQSVDGHLHLPEKVDLADSKVRRLLLFVSAATFANLVIGGSLSLTSVHYMESNQFCGTACHVMNPEFRAYKASLHSNVKCVECHVGEGTTNAVKAKLNGVRQLVMFVGNNYSRPIPSPPHQLKSASETCTNCHDPNRELGERFWRRTKFDDAGNRLETVLVMKRGIHAAHFGNGVSITYGAADVKRQKIVRLSVKKGGKEIEYSAGGDPVLTREMDCLDCHNRPAHAQEIPEHAVDRAMLEGRISSAIPQIRQAALKTLAEEFPSSEAAAKEIGPRLLSWYEKNQPDSLGTHRGQIDQVAKTLVAVYARNVSPEMKVGWGTYPSHMGHTDSPGCFRCHGEELKTKAGQTITQDCESCHRSLAVEEKDPKILQP